MWCVCFKLVGYKALQHTALMEMSSSRSCYDTMSGLHTGFFLAVKSVWQGIKNKTVEFISVYDLT